MQTMANIPWHPPVWSFPWHPPVWSFPWHPPVWSFLGTLHVHIRQFHSQTYLHPARRTPPTQRTINYRQHYKLWPTSHGTLQSGLVLPAASSSLVLPAASSSLVLPAASSSPVLPPHTYIEAIIHSEASKDIHTFIQLVGNHQHLLQQNKLVWPTQTTLW